MKKLSKRRQQLEKKVEPKSYSPQEAVCLLKETATAKFIESAEVHLSLIQRSTTANNPYFTNRHRKNKTNCCSVT